MNRIFLVVLFVTFIATAAPANAANLLTNPGFETGDLTGWSQWNAVNTQVYNWGHNSNYSVAGWWATSGWQDASIADPNTPVKVGGWIYGLTGADALQGGTYADISIQFKRADNSIVGTWSTGQLTSANLVASAWNEETALVTPSSYGTGIDHATLVWEVNNTGTGSGRGLFDDLMVDTQTVPEPTSLLLLGSGLVGLLGLRKKIAK